jgi:hypothetical protein
LPKAGRHNGRGYHEVSSITQLKGVKRNRGKHCKKGRRGGSRPQLHPDPPFIKPLAKTAEKLKAEHRAEDKSE